jgi:putative transcriptional regulator
MAPVQYRRCTEVIVFLVAAMAWNTPSGAADAPPATGTQAQETMLLVARPELQHALYGASIVVARAMPDGSSVGFIINKPTKITLGQVFPEHQPSLKVPDPVFLGGPVGTDLIFALVERKDSPGEGSIPLGPGLFLAMHSDTVDRIIESESEHARFIAGMVVWRPGELAEEMRRGLWYELAPDAGMAVQKKTDGLWEELVGRSERTANMI